MGNIGLEGVKKLKDVEEDHIWSMGSNYKLNECQSVAQVMLHILTHKLRCIFHIEDVWIWNSVFRRFVTL